MTELRQEIARTVYESWVKAADGPDWVSFDGDLPCLALISPEDYECCFKVADALLPLISKAEQRGAERMRERAAEEVEQGSKGFDFQKALAEGFDNDHGYHAGRLAAAAIIRALPPLPTEEE